MRILYGLAMAGILATWLLAFDEAERRERVFLWTIATVGIIAAVSIATLEKVSEWLELIRYAGGGARTGRMSQSAFALAPPTTPTGGVP